MAISDTLRWVQITRQEGEGGSLRGGGRWGGGEEGKGRGKCIFSAITVAYMVWCPISFCHMLFKIVFAVSSIDLWI